MKSYLKSDPDEKYIQKVSVKLQKLGFEILGVQGIGGFGIVF